jgi:hypothetical protein
MRRRKRVRVIKRLEERAAVLVLGAVTQTHRFIIRGSVTGGESISSRASAVINQTAVLFTMPVA